jgi:hypothetical protein
MSHGAGSGTSAQDLAIRVVFTACHRHEALIVITLDIFVIWALAAHGKALVEG